MHYKSVIYLLKKIYFLNRYPASADKYHPTDDARPILLAQGRAGFFIFPDFFRYPTRVVLFTDHITHGLVTLRYV